MSIRIVVLIHGHRNRGCGMSDYEIMGSRYGGTVKTSRYVNVVPTLEQLQVIRNRVEVAPYDGISSMHTVCLLLNYIDRLEDMLNSGE